MSAPSPPTARGRAAGIVRRRALSNRRTPHASRRQRLGLVRRARPHAGSCARPGLARYSRRRLRRRAGNVGLRQVHAAQRDGRLPAALLRLDHAERPRGRGARRRARRRVPEGRAAALEDRSPRMSRSASNSRASAARSGASGRWSCCASSASQISPTPRPTSFPAACASASASRARSRPIPPFS